MKNSSPIPFLMEAEEVQRMCSGSSVESFLSTLVEPTRALARPPISKFRVGAVGMGSSGRVYRGVNVEFLGLPLHHSIHAEQFLITNMARHGENSVLFLAVSAAPCGHCRQFLQELRGAPDIRVVIVDNNAESQSLLQFLPHRFGPDDLLATGFPLLMEPQHNGLVLAPHLNGCNPGYSLQQQQQHLQLGLGCSKFYAGLGERKDHYERIGDLRDAALHAANRSYAPYTNCPSGAAILGRNGEIWSGSYLESAAYNPSLPPLQAALVEFIVSGGDGYDEIECAVVVEKHGAMVKQASSMRIMLDQISPTCPLYVFFAT